MNTWGYFLKVSKTVFFFLYGICVPVYSGVDDSELIMIIFATSQSLVPSSKKERRGNSLFCHNFLMLRDVLGQKNK